MNVKLYCITKCYSCMLEEMKRLISFSLIASFVCLFILCSPIIIFASTYGSGTFGGGNYGEGSSPSSGSSGNSSVSNTISSFFCSAQAPSSAPNLYEIDVTSTTAKVFFSPAGGPYDQHYISYGQGNNNEGYGIDVSTGQTSGALFYVIEQLSPGTMYTFKVRGGNGCKPGPWSNTLTIQTLASGSKTTKKFYLNSQAQYIQALAARWRPQTNNYTNDFLPGVPNTGLGAPSQHATSVMKGISLTQHSATTGSSHSSSLWGSITNFFSGIVHAL